MLIPQSPKAFNFEWPWDERLLPLAYVCLCTLCLCYIERWVKDHNAQRSHSSLFLPMCFKWAARPRKTRKTQARFRNKWKGTKKNTTLRNTTWKLRFRKWLCILGFLTIWASFLSSSVTSYRLVAHGKTHMFTHSQCANHFWDKRVLKEVSLQGWYRSSRFEHRWHEFSFPRSKKARSINMPFNEFTNSTSMYKPFKPCTKHSKHLKPWHLLNALEYRQSLLTFPAFPKLWMSRV